MSKPNRHAAALGRRARGKPKNISPEERARRRAWMDQVNKRRRDAIGAQPVPDQNPAAPEPTKEERGV